ncbi:ketosynthase chain-length factor [Kitasatospora sp. NBC_01302]|uniref:ketosynthase chain-length factor n=1 Tax=Kitasatospora sp. NBC_01302 TaxID=2903575 RepID=UPI002E126B6F|nr:ketosynthase chain-length factor [Kitasatospora sp. NBC_01302]
MTASAVITGIGALAPNGIGIEEYWSAVLHRRSGIRRITRFDPAGYPVRLGGAIDDLDETKHLPSRLLRQTDRTTQLALIAAEWAVADAAIDLETVPALRRGVVTANTAGGFEFGQRELENLWSKGAQHVSAYQSFAWFYAVNTGQIAIHQGMRGSSGVLVSDHAGGLDALAQARRTIRRGAQCVISGGVDGSLCPWGWANQLARGEMSEAEDPDRSYLPFQPNASGYIAGEGGAILFVEDDEAARARGARRYGEIAGFAHTFDPAPGLGRPPALRRAVELALADAQIGAGEVDVVFADASGLREQDRVEADAITDVFGAHGVPVTAPKTMTGRLGAGGAALDVATALLAMRDGTIPPTSASGDLAPGIDLDLVTSARPANVRTALVLARGYGGFNSAMVVKAL